MKKSETFPADIILLSSSLEDGVCYIETSSLDGEKNLKAKLALKISQDEFNSSFKINPEIDNWEIECGLPNSILNNFEGKLTTMINKETHKLNSNQLLLRGTKLKNTEWIIGIIAYTGLDTKIMKNSEKSKYKQSNIEKKTNKYIIRLLFFQLLISAISSIGAFHFQKNLINKHKYLGNNIYKDSKENFFLFCTYFLLNNTMIPISLIVSLEFVKTAQAFFINHDE